MEYKIRHITTQNFLYNIDEIINDYSPNLGKYLSKEGDTYLEPPSYNFMPSHGLNPTAFEIVEFEDNVEINCKKFF